MKDLLIPGTDITPLVDFSYSKGQLEISGRAMPEDTFKFFNPLLDWVEKYKVQAHQKTLFRFKMDYFNTSSEIFILKLIKSLAELKHSGKEVTISWHYKDEDDDMEYNGKYLGKLAGVTIELIAY